MPSLVLPSRQFVTPFGARIDPSHPLAKDLVVFWPLNEGGGTKTADLSAGDNGGTLIGGATWTMTPRGPGVVCDNSSGQWISSAREIGKQAFTNSIWLKVTTFPSSRANIMGQYDVQHTPAYNDRAILVDSDQKARTYFWDGALKYAVCPDALTAEVWYHIVGLGHGNVSSLKIYLNGVQRASTSIGTSPTPAKYLFLGGDWSTNNNGSVITVSDARYWDRVLSPSEVQSLYYEPTAIFRPLKRRWFMQALTEGSVSYTQRHTP